MLIPKKVGDISLQGYGWFIGFALFFAYVATPWCAVIICDRGSVTQSPEPQKRTDAVSRERGDR